MLSILEGDVHMMYAFNECKHDSYGCRTIAIGYAVSRLETRDRKS
jgi:hypothetical protein